MIELARTEIGNYLSPDDPGENGYRDLVGRRSVTDDEAAILAVLATGKDVLEIGTGLGVSTRAMAATARSVITVDPDPWVQQNIEIPESVVRLTDWPSGTFDLVFIDGNHRFQSAAHDLERAVRVIRRPGRVVVHDCNLEGVARACSSVFWRPADEDHDTACAMRSWCFE